MNKQKGMETAQRLQEVAALPEDPDAILGIHKETHNCL